MGSIRIETTRLIIRRMRIDDAKDAFVWLGDPSVFEYEESMPLSSVDEVRAIFRMSEPSCSILAIETKNIGLIGQFDIGTRSDGSVEIGYWIAKEYWGQGYADEALNALVEYLAAQGIKEIKTEVNIDNKRSLRVLDKCGFKLVSEKKRPRLFKGDEANYGTFVYMTNVCKRGN